MPGLSKKETARLLDYIEPQGVKVTPVKNGYLLRLPNGESTTVHLSVSDHRGPANLRGFLRRNGISWPTDKHSPKKLSKETVSKGDAVIEKLGYPNSVSQKTLRQAMLLIDWKPTSETIGNYMRSIGYQAIGNTVNLMWKIPDEIVELPPTPIVSISKDPLPEILHKETTVEIREFLDSHDSWTVNMDILPDSMTVHDMKLMFAALGISFEVRVWK